MTRQNPYRPQRNEDTFRNSDQKILDNIPLLNWVSLISTCVTVAAVVAACYIRVANAPVVPNKIMLGHTLASWLYATAMVAIVLAKISEYLAFLASQRKIKSENTSKAKDSETDTVIKHQE